MVGLEQEKNLYWILLGKIMKNKIKLDNMKYDGTFEQFVKSIADEIKRILSVELNTSDKQYFDWHQKQLVELEYTTWENGFTGEKIPAISIVVTNIGDKWNITSYFGFCKEEFDEYENDEKQLRLLAQARFIDFIWGLYGWARGDFLFLQKLGIDPSKSLDEVENSGK
jgi:hypothetical protein